MILDQDLIISDDQAVTGDAISTNIVQIDGLGDVMGATGLEEDLYINVQVTTTMGSGGAPTLDIDLVSHSAAPTDGAYSILKILDDVGLGSLVQGYAVSRSLRGLPLKEYTGVYFLTNTADFTAGKIRVWISTVPFATNLS